MHSVREIRPQLILKVSDRELGFLGYLVIDQSLFGRAIGGVRMRDGLTLDEVAKLAREMTLKFAFLNIPVGGAKAAVIWKPFSSDEERERIFTAFGKNLGPLLTKNICSLGEDLGTYSQDIYHIKRGAGIDIQRPRSNNGISAYYTAITVFVAAEQLANSLGLKLSGSRVAIEGLGKVGTCVAKLFSDAGADIVGVSTIKGGIYNPEGIDIVRLIELKSEAGDEAVNHYHDAETIPKENLLALDTDILVPCAAPYTITKDNVSQLKAKIVVPGANIAATDEAESVMLERGIHYMPSFVSSSGGILAYALFAHGFGRTNAEKIMKKGFGKKISSLIEISHKECISLGQKTREIAESNLKGSEQLMRHKQEEKLMELSSMWQKGGLRKHTETVLWRSYKLSFKFRASFLLRLFATKYMEDKLSMEVTPWTDL
jgi:glutamate dehydrogenase (NAD(P)+)